MVAINLFEEATFSYFWRKGLTWRVGIWKEVFVSSNGQTPLVISIRHGSRLVRMLLDAGASVKVRTSLTKQTVLNQAVFTNFCADLCADSRATEDLAEVAKLLLAAECDVDALAMFQYFDMTALIVLCLSVTVQLCQDFRTPELDSARRHRVLLETVRIFLDAGQPVRAGHQSRNLTVELVDILLGRRVRLPSLRK